MYTLDKKVREKKEHSYNIVIGFYILRTKKVGEIKRRGETREERHPDKRNERIKKYKKKDSVFLISCLLFPFCACQRIGISASEREEKD